MAKVETRSGSEITITYGGDEVVKVDYPFGLDDWRHRATVMCSYENSPADSDQLPPLSGLEVTELRTTAPTTMRRWDQYFAPDAAYEGFRFKDWKPSDDAVIEPAATATLANGMTVRGTQGWVDKMVAYYGKKSEPEADPKADVPRLRFDTQQDALNYAARVVQECERWPHVPQFELTQADCDRLSKSLASRTIDVPEGLSDAEIHAFLLGETPADPTAILAAEYAKACEAETAADWQDMRFIDGNITNKTQIQCEVSFSAGSASRETAQQVAAAASAQVKRAASRAPVTDSMVSAGLGVLRESGIVDGEMSSDSLVVRRILEAALSSKPSQQPEPKRYPNAKPALPSLSIEAPLGNRYGGLGWCDE